MQITIDIGQTINEALQAAMAPARIRELIDKNIAKTVDEVVANQFRSYSPFAKTLETAVAALMPHELSIDGADSFTDLVKKMVTARVNAVNDERLQQSMASMLDDLLKPAPPILTMSELVAAAVERWDTSSRRREADQPTVVVEASSGSMDGWYHIGLDPISGKSLYGCRIRLDVTDKGEVYSLKIEDREITNSLLVGPMYDVDRYVMHLYTGKTRLKVDRTNFDDVCYPERECACD